MQFPLARRAGRVLLQRQILGADAQTLQAQAVDLLLRGIVALAGVLGGGMVPLPLGRGAGAVFAAVAGMVFLGEPATLARACAIALVAAGIAWLALA